MFFTDDDHDDLFLMKEVSDALGHTSQLFHSGSEMLAVIKNQKLKPDLIFLDITMPREDGFEVLEKLRSIDNDFKNIPVIIHSGNCDEKCIQKCFELGANYYITKAHDFKDLSASMEYAINKDWTTYKSNREDFLHLYV